MRPLKLVAIVGPTASGKSAWGVELAKKFNGVIISADSRQIYRGMDVGTTKISKKERKKIPHYMLDIVDPDDDFSVSLYQKSVLNLLKSIEHKNRKLKKQIVPFLVGGTGLYIAAVTDGLQFPNVPPNPALRAELEKLSLEDLVSRLICLDPDTQADIKNKRRVIRAIEIIQSGSNRLPQIKPDFEVLKIGLGKDWELLKKGIEMRVKKMDITALVKETKKLLKKRYDFNRPALSALGYREVRSFINKKITREGLTEKLIRLHIRYAKKQMAWFKRDPKTHWIKNRDQAEKLVANFLSR